MKIGLLADIHGDLPGFQTALRLFDQHNTGQIICAGDIVDRGPNADTIRDSHTCALLTLPGCTFQLVNLTNGTPIELPLVEF